MPEIFVSYRRSDSLSATGRLADELEQRFGDEQVFRDLEAIEAGADFERTILDALRAATVVLAVIGRTWPSVRDASGRHRLDHPEDYVRRELETALAAGVSVIPVLVEGAAMPTKDELPPSLRELARRQAFELSERRWHEDTDQLVAHLERGVGIEATGRPPRRLPVALLEAVRSYVPDLLLLLVRPKTLIARRNFGRPQDLVRALVFLGLSLLVGFGLMLTVWPMKEASAPVLLGLALLNGTAMTLLVSIPLYLAWRLAGAPPEYRRVAVPLCYQAAVVTLGVSAGFLGMVVPLLLADPRLLERYREVFLGGAAGVERKIGDAVETFATASTGAAAMVGILLMLVVHAALLGWLVVAWGAYRQSLGLSRSRSLVGAIAFAVLLVLPCYGVLALASYLGGR